MKVWLLLLFAFLAAACVAGRSSEPYALSDGSTAITISCEDGWAQCYSTANRTCGAAGYEEIDRAMDAALSNAGRLETRVFTGRGRDNQVYREEVRSEVETGVITIRCKRP